MENIVFYIFILFTEEEKQWKKMGKNGKIEQKWEHMEDVT